MKNIVSLDAYSVNHGAVNFTGLRNPGTCTYYDRMPHNLCFKHLDVLSIKLE